MDSTTIRVVVESISGGIIEAFSGRRFTLAGLEQGTESRIGMTGWTTVKWPVSERPANSCGRAAIGGDYVELFNSAACGRCTYARLVKHEIGHAMGFWHTDDRNDVTYPSSTNDCDNNPSPRERLHAAIAYQRPIGSTDIDNDPSGASLSLPQRVAE